MWNPESGKICIELLTVEGTKVSLAVFVPIDAELNETGQTPEEAVARLWLALRRGRPRQL